MVRPHVIMRGKKMAEKNAPQTPAPTAPTTPVLKPGESIQSDLTGRKFTLSATNQFGAQNPKELEEYANALDISFNADGASLETQCKDEAEADLEIKKIRAAMKKRPAYSLRTKKEKLPNGAYVVYFGAFPAKEK